MGSDLLIDISLFFAKANKRTSRKNYLHCIQDSSYKLQGSSQNQFKKQGKIVWGSDLIIVILKQASRQATKLACIVI
jgi:hypothetical protein